MSEAPQAIRWKRLLAEGFAIVVSILLALAVDQAWEGRSDRLEEREELVRLNSEINSNLERFQAEVGAQISLVEHADSLLRILDQAADEQLLVIDNGLLLSLLFSPIWKPETPVLDALIASGRLRLIEDRNVREGIARLSSRFSSIDTSQAVRARTHYMEQLLPYLSANEDIASLARERRIDAEELRRTGGYPWTVAEGVTTVRNTTHFRNLVELQRLFSGEALRQLGESISDLESVRASVEADLE